MKKTEILLLLLLPVLSNLAFAQTSGEESELSREELDARFSAEDAAREAAAWSDVVIDRSRPDPLVGMTAAADLVFRGTVSSQQVIYDGDDLPFTHTTFSISNVLKGSHAPAEITLIQEGGPAWGDEDSVVIVSDAMHFNVGDDELLFLGLDPDNTVAERRVSIERRLRIHNDKVYNDNGRGLLVTPSQDGTGYRLGWSKDRNPAPRFSQIHIGSHTFTKAFGKPENNPDSDGEQLPQDRRAAAGYQSSVDVTTFSALITD